PAGLVATGLLRRGIRLVLWFRRTTHIHEIVLDDRINVAIYPVQRQGDGEIDRHDEDQHREYHHKTFHRSHHRLLHRHHLGLHERRDRGNDRDDVVVPFALARRKTELQAE